MGEVVKEETMEGVASLEEVAVFEMEEVASLEKVVVFGAEEETTPTLTEAKKHVVDVPEKVVGKRPRLPS